MNTSAKVKWLGGLLGLCILAILVESYFLWEQDKQPENPVDQTLSSAWPQHMDPWSDNWDPTAQFQQMQKQMNQLMDQMSSGGPVFSQQGFGFSPSSPKITTREEDDKYEVDIQVPKGEEVEVNTNVADNQLTIDGKVKRTEQKQANNFQGQSESISQFSQTMSFADPIDESKMQVERHGNEIVITVPKLS